MQFSFSKEWFLKKALEEDCTCVNAGILNFRENNKVSLDECSCPAVDDVRVAFGKLMQLIRRQHGLSYEKLSQEADIDIDELKNIETNPTCRPELRTVHQLATTFKLNTKKLAQLAGLTERRDAELETNALAFAARSDSISKISPEELEILETFVAVLTEKR